MIAIKSKLPAFFVLLIFGSHLSDCSLTCQKTVDVVLVAEDSSVLDANSVSAVQNFLAYIAKRFIVNQYDTGSRIAFVLYNSDPRTVFNLNDKTSTTDVIAAILASDFKRDSGTPNITKAFEHTYQEVLRVVNGERSCQPTVVILLSYSSSVPNRLSGPPYDDVPQEVASAREIQNAAGLVLTVGIGGKRDTNSLIKIANNDITNYFDFPDFSSTQLSDTKAGPIADAACNYVSTNPLLPYPSVMEQVKVDVTFVVDISQTLTNKMVNGINSYFQKFLTPYLFGPTGVQASLVTYSRTADIAILFKTSDTLDKFLKLANSAIDPPPAIPDRNIYDALEQVNNHLLVPSSGNRADVPQEIFIFTSACYTGPDPVPLAQQLRSKARIHVITMGSSAGFWKEALDIAGNPENFYYIADNPDIVIPSFFPYRSWVMLGKYSQWIPPTVAPILTTTTAQPGIDACADLVFILDESEVLRKTDSQSNEWNTAWETVKQFIIDFSNQFVIGQNHMRVSVIGFGGQAQVQFALTDSTDQSSLDIKVKGLELISGARNAAGGFQAAYDHINQNKRTSGPVYAVFISVDADDVNAPADVTTAATKLSQLNVNLYLIPMKNFYPASTSFPTQISNIKNAYQGSQLYQMGNYRDLSSNAFKEDLLNTIKNDAMCAAPKSGTGDDAVGQTTAVPQNLQAWTCKSGYRADIALIVDQSTSIPADQYKAQVIPYLTNLVDNFDITNSNSHLAMLRFCDPSKEANEVVFNFKATQDKNQLKSAITNNAYCGGSTSLEYAMNYTYTNVFGTPDQGVRPLDAKTSHLAIIITDGLATDAVNASNIQAAQLLVSANVQLFSVAVGPLQSPTHLQMLTGRSDPNNVFKIEEFQPLSDKVKALVCKGG